MTPNDRWQKQLKQPCVYTEIEEARKKIDAVLTARRIERRNDRIAFAIIAVICALMLHGLLT